MVLGPVDRLVESKIRQLQGVGLPLSYLAIVNTMMNALIRHVTSPAVVVICHADVSDIDKKKILEHLENSGKLRGQFFKPPHVNHLELTITRCPGK